MRPNTVVHTDARKIASEESCFPRESFGGHFEAHFHWQRHTTIGPYVV